MTTSQYISVRETAQILGVTEKNVMDMIESRKLQAYRIADKFLRLKKADVLNLRNSEQVTKENHTIAYTPPEKILDFIYFNDFYMISGLIILALLFIIFYA